MPWLLASPGHQEKIRSVPWLLMPWPLAITRVSAILVLTLQGKSSSCVPWGKFFTTGALLKQRKNRKRKYVFFYSSANMLFQHDEGSIEHPAYNLFLCNFSHDSGHLPWPECRCGSVCLGIWGECLEWCRGYCTVQVRRLCLVNSLAPGR